MLRYEFADCELHPKTRCLRRGGREVPVEPKVFDLLLYLIENRDRYLTREELLEAVWAGVVVAPAALSRAVKEARRAVGDDGERQAVIATLHGRGYRFVAEVIERGDAPAAVRPTPARSMHRPDDSTQRREYSVASSRRGDEMRAGVVFAFPRYAGHRRFPDRGQLRLGRGGDCDLVLSGNDVSRHHAEVFRDGPIHVVRDLGSTNGTYLNGVQVQQAPLALGDVLRLGDAIGVVVRAAAETGADEPRELAPATGMIGGAAFAAALRPLRAAAQDSVPVVITGETGTGKELAARALHAWSGRSGPLVAVQCAALDPAHATSALFGDGGANAGLLANAHGGTLLLDHVADLPLAVQSQLLRALERGELPPREDGVPRSVDVRVIATSQEPLARAVQAGQLRPDLHARLEGIALEIPPLRARCEDVPGLFLHFARRYGGGRAPEVTPGLVEKLCLYDWPYNVRELQALVRRLLLEHAHEPPLRSAHLPEHVRDPARPRGGERPDDTSRTRLGRLVGALREHGGSVARASSAAGMSVAEAYEIMEAPHEEDE